MLFSSRGLGGFLHLASPLCKPSLPTFQLTLPRNKWWGGLRAWGILPVGEAPWPEGICGHRVCLSSLLQPLTACLGLWMISAMAGLLAAAAGDGDPWLAFTDWAGGWAWAWRHTPWGGVGHALTLSALFNCFLRWALNLGVGASISGWQGLVFCLGHLIAVWPPPTPSLYPPSMGKPISIPVSRLSRKLRWVSGLCSDSGVWGLSLPSPVPAPWCTTHRTPGPPPSLDRPFPSGYSALYCLQHHSNLSVCPLLGLGSQGSLGGMGCSLEFTPRPGAAILSLILPTDTPERRSPFGVGGEDFISIQAGDGGVLFFFLFFFFFLWHVWS